MSHDQPTQLWRGFGASVLGENHRRTGKPNQDAIGWHPQSGVGAPVVLTIADGHGGAAYTRSAQGAALAVQVTNKVLYALLSDPARLQAVRSDPAARVELADLIVTSWRNSIDALIGAAGVPDPQRFVPFGTTMLSAAIGADCILYLQLGDGDLVILDSAGETTRPFPPDPRLTGNATTSLCLPDAADYLHILAAPRHPAPVMIAMATDGYANSFQDEAGFLDAWRDIAVHLGQQGPDRLAHSLQGWLAETTKLGSGDDITVGLLACLDGRIASSQMAPAAKQPTPAAAPIKSVPADLPQAAPSPPKAAIPMPLPPEPVAAPVGRAAPTARPVSRAKYAVVGLIILAIGAAAWFAFRPAPPVILHVITNGPVEGPKSPPPSPLPATPPASSQPPATLPSAPPAAPVKQPAPPPAAGVPHTGTGGTTAPPPNSTVPGPFQTPSDSKPKHPPAKPAAPSDQRVPPSAAGTQTNQSPAPMEGNSND